MRTENGLLAESQVYNLSKRGETKTDIAKFLGLSQGYVSSVYNKAKDTIHNAELNDSTPDEYVWKCWNMFVEKGKMPNFLDIKIETVISDMIFDLMPFFNWYYSVGELCRYILTYYIFNEDKIEQDIAKYKQAVDEEERSHFEDYYGNKFPVIQGVYVRLYMGLERRKQIGLSDSSKAYYGIYGTVEKIAKRLNTTVYVFVFNRFYPFFAGMRNKRYRQFYKNYSGKKLPD